MFRLPCAVRVGSLNSRRGLIAIGALSFLFWLCLPWQSLSLAAAQSQVPTSNQVGAAIPDGPVITSFTATVNADGSWTLHGHVDDPDPTGVVVQFGGIDCLNGRTTTVDSNGNFSYTFMLPPGQTGIVGGVATNDDFEESEEADVYVGAIQS